MNGREASDVEPILAAAGDVGQYIFCSSAGVYKKSPQMPHQEEDETDPNCRHKVPATCHWPLVLGQGRCEWAGYLGKEMWARIFRVNPVLRAIRQRWPHRADQHTKSCLPSFLSQRMSVGEPTVM